MEQTDLVAWPFPVARSWEARLAACYQGLETSEVQEAHFQCLPRFVAYCPEIPGANGQGKTKAACLKSLSEAIDLILEDRRDDALRGLPANAIRALVAVG